MEFFIVAIILLVIGAYLIYRGVEMADFVKGLKVEIERDQKIEEDILAALNRIADKLERIDQRLNRIDAKIPPVDLAGVIEFNYDDGQKVETMQRTDEQTDPVHVKLSVKDRKGKDAKLDGIPVWESSDESIATVAADEDGLGANVTPTGEVGECVITAKGDADLGEGVKEIVGTLPVVITAGEAVELSITEG